MAKYTYPNSDLDQSRNLLALLGSHWDGYWSDQGVVESYLFAKAQEEAQSYLNLVETLAAISRLEVPVFHTDNWYFLQLKESDKNNRPYRFGDGSVVGDGKSFGEQITTNDYRWEIPEDFADAKLIFNRLTEPSVTYTKGIDFKFGDREIIFTSDPFANSYVVKNDIYESGEVTDQVIGLWVYRGSFDWEVVYDHFGFLINEKLKSSEGYKDLVNAVLDATVEGTSAKQVQLAWAAMSGLPVVVEAVETVELVQEDNNYLVIATDANVYKYPKGQVANAAVGDEVRGGDFLTDAVRVYEFNQGVTPAELAAINVGPGMIADGFIEGITFRNETVSVVVEEDVDGKTKVSWELGGFPTVVSDFWDEVHSRGVASGVSLANLLDIRAEPVGEPGSASLPATINPLEWLVENLLRFNAFAVRVDVAAVGASASLSSARLFRRITPPWTAMIVIYELAAPGETITLDGTDEQLGIAESLLVYHALDPFTETVDLTAMVTEKVSIYQVEGVCK